MDFALADARDLPDAAADARARALARLVETHLRGVFRFLRVLGCPHAEAEDLAQEVFVIALRRIGDRTGAEASAFLLRTARHVFLQSRSKERRRAALLADAAERLWARCCGDATGDAAVRALRQCVGGLAPRARELVHLFYGEGCARTEVATALGMREAGVKTALQRVRARLRDCLERSLR